jgi:hypothetical protein
MSYHPGVPADTAAPSPAGGDFYASSLKGKARIDYLQALHDFDPEHEACLLRCMLNSFIKKNPGNLVIVMRCVHQMERMLIIRNKMLLTAQQNEINRSLAALSALTALKPVNTESGPPAVADAGPSSGSEPGGVKTGSAVTAFPAAGSEIPAPPSGIEAAQVEPGPSTITSTNPDSLLPDTSGAAPPSRAYAKKAPSPVLWFPKKKSHKKH